VQKQADVSLFPLASAAFPTGSSAMHNGITPGGGVVVGLTFDGALDRGRGYVVRGDAAPSFLAFPLSASSTSALTQAWDVNPRGTIVGNYLGADGKTRGFSLDESGYHTIDVAGSTMTAARGINPQGAIVGIYNERLPTGATRTHGFLLTK
jgi:hypothetical protein